MDIYTLIKKRKQIGYELRTIRIDKNYSMRFMARLTKLNRHTIERIEDGELNYSIDSLIIYKDGLNKQIIFEDVK